jgi:spermidine/putrescine ABC transporter ATP-binding subunit
MPGRVTTPETTSRAQGIRLVDVCKNFGPVAAVVSVSISVQPGEFLTLLGPSGSGKSTTLMLIAGFELPTSGEITIGSRIVNGVPPQHRNLGVVFQNYALFPHMTVFENVAYPLRARGWSAPAISRAISGILEKVRLRGLDSRYPSQLSGGQQQRVALARALVFDPPVLLMDESLGALDKKLREQLQIEIKRLQKELGITVVAVTHDQSEALTMSDRVAVMNEGHIVQVGSPEELYDRPATLFVADFVGETNFFDVRVDATDALAAFTSGGRRIKLPAPQVPGSRLTVALRPERIKLANGVHEGTDGASTQADTQWEQGEILETIFVGEVRRYVLRVHDLTLNAKIRTGAAHGFSAGDRVQVGWHASDLKSFQYT